MNFDLYLLGTPDGYDQYPNDDKAAVFSTFHNAKLSDSQLTIYRRAELVYYVYTRNVTTDINSRYFGLAIALNGLYLTDLNRVLDVFEQLFSNITLRGKILKIGITGKIGFACHRFSEDISSIDDTFGYCREIIEENLNKCVADLPVEHEQSRKDIEVNLEDVRLNARLSKLLREYSCIRLSREVQSDGGYVESIINNLYKENKKLKDDYAKLLRQKKQTTWVIILIFSILIGGLFALYSIDGLNNTVDGLRRTVDERDETIQSLNDSLESAHEENSRKERVISRMQEDSTQQALFINSQQEQIELLRRRNREIQQELDQYKYDYGDYEDYYYY